MLPRKTQGLAVSNLIKQLSQLADKRVECRPPGGGKRVAPERFGQFLGCERVLAVAGEVGEQSATLTTGKPRFGDQTVVAFDLHPPEDEDTGHHR